MRAFFIRLLQIIWVAGFLGILMGLFINIAYNDELIATIIVSIIWLLFFAGIQYLFFSTLNPRSLFDSRLIIKEVGHINKKFFAILVAAALGLTVIGGIAIKLYQSYQYNQKIEAGNDVGFYSKLLKDSAYKYEIEDCYADDRPKKAEIQKVSHDLKSTGVNGLNIILTLANQDDRIGNSIRCAITEDIGIEELAKLLISTIKKYKPDNLPSLLINSKF